MKHEKRHTRREGARHVHVSWCRRRQCRRAGQRRWRCGCRAKRGVGVVAGARVAREGCEEPAAAQHRPVCRCRSMCDSSIRHCRAAPHRCYAGTTTTTTFINPTQWQSHFAHTHTHTHTPVCRCVDVPICSSLFQTFVAFSIRPTFSPIYLFIARNVLASHTHHHYHLIQSNFYLVLLIFEPLQRKRRQFLPICQVYRTIFWIEMNCLSKIQPMRI